MKIYEGAKAIFDKQIDELFEKKKDSEMDIVLKTLSLIIYQTSANTDMVELYRLLPIQDFAKVVNLFDGKTVKFPNAKDFKENLILCLIYYYKEVKNLSWKEVKSKFPFDISGISYGKKIIQLNSFIKEKMNELFDKIS